MNKIKSSSASMEDVQNHIDTREIAINRVGIKSIRHPIHILGRDGQLHPTVALFDMYVNLPHNQKGTHMSRFVALLNDRVHEISVHSFSDLIEEMTLLLQADEGFLSIDFPYFINKEAPISGVRSNLDYQVTLKGQWSSDAQSMSLKVVVPVTSLCPCSKKISDYGAHSQRSHITLTITPSESMTIEDIIDCVEREASSELFSLLKRPDEKFVTEQAYDNPKFVEDIVRDIANDLNQDTRVAFYRVEAENFESIHNHSAYAMIERDKLI